MMDSQRTDSTGPALDCEQVAHLLPAYLEGGARVEDREAVAAHLSRCARCRHRYQNEKILAERLGDELKRSRQRPSSAASWRIRHRMEHRIRRRDIMIRTRQTVWGAVALALFLVITGLFFWWQSGGVLTMAEGESTPVGEESELLTGAEPTPAVVTPPAQSGDEAPPGEQAVVQLAIFDFQAEEFGELVAAFEDENPDVDVQIVYIQDIIDYAGEWPDDAFYRLAAAADVSQYFTGPTLAREGVILDLRPFIESDPTITADDFYADSLEAFEWQGGIWGIPTEIVFQLMAYDKNAFDAAGLPYPQPGWTWDEFLAAAKALTRPGEQWGLIMPLSESTTLIEARGGPLWDVTFSPPRLRLTEPEVVEATQWYADLFLVHEVAPYLKTPEPDASGSFPIPGSPMIFDGQAAMWPEGHGGWSATVRGLRSNGVEPGIAPFPISEANDQSTPINTFHGLGISAGSQNPEAAWRLVSFLSRQEIGDRLYAGDPPSHLPARRSVAEAAGFWEQVDPELGEALRYALDHSYYRHRLPISISAVDTIFRGWLADILTGRTPVEVSMVSVQSALEAAAAEQELARQEATPVPNVAPPEATPQLAEGDVAIRFVAETTGSAGRQALNALVERFNDIHPDIVVQLEAPNFQTAPSTLLDQARNADCILWQNPRLNAETREALINLDPLLDADSSVHLGDFYTPALAPFLSEGRLWGLPASINVPVLAYDKRLFDAAGLAYPSSDWTPEQFQEAAIALSQGVGDERQYGFVPGVYEPTVLLAMLERSGAVLLDEAASPVHSTFDHPATVDAMGRYAALSTEHEAKPLFTTAVRGVRDESARRALLMEGRAAMWFEYAEDHVVGQAPPHVGYVALPAVSPTASPGFQSTAAFFISAGASDEARNACWQWVAFASEEPQAVDAGLPARRSVAESEAFSAQVGAELAQAYADTVAESSAPALQTRMRSEEQLGWFSLGWYWLAQAYDRIVTEGEPVEAALQEAQEAADAFRTCTIARGEGAMEPCMRDVDPRLAESLFGADE